MDLIILFLIAGVPYALLHHGLKIVGPVALSVSLLLMPVTAYGLMAIAQVLGVSGTGVMGLVLMIGSLFIGVPAGVILLATHFIFWRKRP